MENFSNIGINFDVFENTSALYFNFTNMTKEEFIAHIPEQANAITNDYYGIIVLFVLGIFLIWMLSDISQYGLFRYNSTRAFGIALGIMSTIGIMMMSVGYMTNYIHLSTIVALYLMMLIYTIIYNPS